MSDQTKLVPMTQDEADLVLLFASAYGNEEEVAQLRAIVQRHDAALPAAELRAKAIKAILSVGCCSPDSEWCISRGPESCDCLRQVDAVLAALGVSK